METNVYNIVWADDEIDELLDDETVEELESSGFKIVGRAHNGIELENCLQRANMVDAVIVDANFNESEDDVRRERDTSGLTYARGIYTHHLKGKIPFFLFTNRSDELLKEIYQDNPNFLRDFPRHERWFHKGLGEQNEMLGKIKEAVDKTKSPAFVVRNKYKLELNAATLFDNIYNYLFEFLINEYNDTVGEIKEPFVRVRRSIEEIFSACEKMNLIPPISDNINGTANYFLNNTYKIQGPNGVYNIEKYKMLQGDLMPKPLAQSLKFVCDITQDGSHSKSDLKLKVDEYWKKSKDVLLVKSVVYILMDVVKWYAFTALNNRDTEENRKSLWIEI